MSVVFWDTNLFIYLWRDFGKLSGQVLALRNRMLTRGDELLTSAMTLGEILVKPIQSGDAKAVAYYQNLIATTATVIPFAEKAAIVYARLRADRSLRAPDTIQLACAAAAGTDLFITNDTRLHSMQIPGIQFVVPLDRVPI
jgi:predicted nucleic acid-binding protein